MRKAAQGGNIKNTSNEGAVMTHFTMKGLRGDQLPHSKLNEKLVKRIREEREEAIKQRDQLNKKIHARELAKEYNVHIRTIEKVLAGYSWTHI